ncbi:DUF177 domain-containing protein [Myxococcota bacterium]|nr:DUF177 domain-containing protein [Myxococcota bacterium]MBU1379956.1 DUF177 domain-containing protein [Myxococcota bacterium]MBU1496488.1 DUF177 domain-containing protein [Myxococcota bacterium]
MRKVILQFREIKDAPKELEVMIDNEAIAARFGELIDTSRENYCNGVITAEKLQGAVSVVGSLQSKLHLICSKCLETFEYKVPEWFNLILMPAPQAFKDEVELESSDLDVVYYKGEQIDLTDHVLDHMIVEIPMNPVCSENCNGVNYKCEVPEEDEIDPRWAALKNISSNDKK